MLEVGLAVKHISHGQKEGLCRDAAERIRRARVPVLVVHGSEDRLIPPALGRALFELAPEPKRFVLVDGGTHHNTNGLAQDQYRAAMTQLFGLPATR